MTFSRTTVLLTCCVLLLSGAVRAGADSSRAGAAFLQEPGRVSVSCCVSPVRGRDGAPLRISNSSSEALSYQTQASGEYSLQVSVP
jgi:hypothetical protein